MNVIIVDIETSGLDPKVDRLIEIGTITFSLNHREILEQRSQLVCQMEPFVNGAFAVNRISSDVLCDQQSFTDVSYPNFGFGLGHKDATLVAHGADFERAWLGDGNWLCTMRDFEWPEGVKAGGSCVDLALSHQVPVPYAHRALDDCRLIAEVFRKYSFEQLQSMFWEAAKPRREFQAMVSFEDKDLAKNAGFYWDGAKRVWLRRLQVEKAEAGGYGFTFPVKITGLTDRT